MGWTGQQDTRAGGHLSSPSGKEQVKIRELLQSGGREAPAPFPTGLAPHGGQPKDQQSHLQQQHHQGLTKNAAAQPSKPELAFEPHGTHMHIQVWEVLKWVLSFLLPRKPNALQVVNTKPKPMGVKRKAIAPNGKTLFPR